METTRNQLGLALQTLLAHPDQWRLLGERPELGGQGRRGGDAGQPDGHLGDPRGASRTSTSRGCTSRRAASCRCCPTRPAPTRRRCRTRRSTSPRCGRRTSASAPGVHHCLGPLRRPHGHGRCAAPAGERMPDAVPDGPGRWLPVSGNTGPVSFPSGSHRATDGPGRRPAGIRAGGRGLPPHDPCPHRFHRPARRPRRRAAQRPRPDPARARRLARPGHRPTRRCASRPYGPDAGDALEGVDTLFMVSAAEAFDRRDQHRAFIDAAARAGVGHIVYTSFSGAAPDADFTLGRDHADAEQAIKRQRDGLHAAARQLLRRPAALLRRRAGRDPRPGRRRPGRRGRPGRRRRRRRRGPARSQPRTPARRTSSPARRR